MFIKGLVIIILGLLLNIITHYKTRKDDDKIRRYTALSAGTLLILLGFYVITPQDTQVNEKISLEDIKTKVQLFNQPR